MTQVDNIPSEISFLKRCPTCQTEKQRSFFYSNKSTKDGVQVQCIVCASLHVKRVRQDRTQKKITAKRDDIAAREEIGKACFRCGCVKSLSCYRTDGTKADGVVASCKDCMRSSYAVAQKKHYAGNTDAVRASTAKYQALFKKEYARARRLKRKRECMALSDVYVAKLLTQNTSALKPNALPKALIEAKRLEVLISRYLKEEL